ncbi:MAG: glycoside hydrolase family 2 [Armatimonadetes bacterium]|nr:glycoside hydrolase family 2 [Armatimonadota bacterium]
MRQLRWAVLATILAGTMVSAQGYKLAPGPIKTRWAAKVSPTNCLPEYPRPTMAREAWSNLNGLWDYAIAAKADAQPTAFEGKILVPYAVESQLSGVGRAVQPDQKLWYHRSFNVPGSWRGKRVLLHFGAVDWDTTVLVNGQQVATHRGGYDGFSADITKALATGAAQELVVAVTDPTTAGPQPRGKQTLKPGGIFYTPTTGIWQTVWMEPVAEKGIDALKMAPDVAGSCLKLTVTAGAESVRALAYDGNRVVGRIDGAPGTELKVPVPNPKLWSPDSPTLYRLVVSSLVGGKEIDKVDSYFGMRSVSLGKDDKGVLRPMLNGKFIFQVGFLDQGFWPDGIYTAPTDEALRWDIETSKKLGMNMARKHVKVEPERWYYWCDKLGLLVWQDMPSPFSTTDEAKAIYEKELRAMIAGRYNHPSIYLWVVFNEGWGQHDTPARVDLVRQLDSTRLINNASGWTDAKCGDVIDMHNYPGPGSPKPEETRAAVLGEFGGLGLGLKDHVWTADGWGYRAAVTREKLTSDYVKLLRKAYQLRDEAGLSAVVYTQTTDCEMEINGLITYDREIIKPDVETVSKANRGIFPPAPKEVTIVPASDVAPQTWRYTTTKPNDGWQSATFDDAGWKEGPGGFGTVGTPGAKVGTEWRTSDIWLRRAVDLPKVDFKGLALRLHHDEDAEVFVNGTQIFSIGGYTSEYELQALDKAAMAAFKPGRNVLAVHCKQTMGGQYIDLGLTDLVP